MLFAVSVQNLCLAENLSTGYGQSALGQSDCSICKRMKQRDFLHIETNSKKLDFDR